MMKKITLCLLVLSGMILACQPDQSSTGNDENANEDSTFPASKNEIEAIVTGIQNSLDTMQERGPLTVNRGDDTWEIYAYYINQDPQMLRAISNEGEQVYYFSDRRVVQLQEFANVDDGFVEERVFLYNEDEVVDTKVRRAASRLGLQEKEFKRYRSPYGDEDFRLDVNQVNGLAIGFIYGQ